MVKCMQYVSIGLMSLLINVMCVLVTRVTPVLCLYPIILISGCCLTVLSFMFYHKVHDLANPLIGVNISV